ncbi:MAG TPA: hypothetical protein VFT89_07330 [Rhizobiaceae bacterium]|nr:hypothetical protein [Rhizobiaceae bacterium]
MASALIGALRIVLGMDSAAFDEGVSLAEKKLNAFGKRMGKVGSQMQKLGAGLTVGISAPLAFLGKGMIQAASDAAESASAFDFLFKDQAASVRAWADTMAKEIGRSTFALQDQALAFQQYFSQVAPTNEKAAELSKTFTSLAQDLASFYNVTESDALEKLRSGLAGEAEPLRSFGVFLSAAAVEAKAMEMGLADANGEISEQNKVLARAAVILDQTKAAQGDAARTAGSFANQQKALSAALSDIGIKLGTILLPVALKVVQALQSMAQWFSSLSPATQEWIVILGGAAAVIGPMVATLGLIASGISALIPLLPALGAAFAAMTGPVGLTVTAIAGIGIAVYQNWDKVKAAVAGIVQAFVELKDKAIAAIQAMVTGVTTWLGNKLNAAFDKVKEKINAVKQTFANLYDAVVGHSYIPDMVTEIGQHMARLPNLMNKPVDQAVGATESAFSGLNDQIGSTFEGFGSSIADAIKGTKDWTDVIKDALGQLAKLAFSQANLGGMGGFGGFLSGLFNGLLGFADGGSFAVAGAGGIDSQLVAFKATPGERVSITKPGQDMGGGPAYAPVYNIDARGADVAAVARLERGLAQRDRLFDKRVDQRTHIKNTRGTRG